MLPFLEGRGRGILTTKINSIRSFLVKPGKGDETQKPIGVDVSLEGRVYDLLAGIFHSTDKDCNIDIRFRSITGNQDNDVRNLLISYIEEANAEKSMDIARDVAHSLQNVTTNLSGQGLLFLISGTVGEERKFVISRFPADNGIVAEEGSSKLEISFIEQVFMKNMRAYKAVAYNNLTSTSNVWKGRAVDKQITDLKNPTSRYWIEGFLSSEFSITATLGSERFADALRKVMNGGYSDDVKSETAAAAGLLKNHSGQATTVSKLLDDLKLSDDTKQAIYDNFPNKKTVRETFEFNIDAFSNVYKYKAVILDNGVMITAEANDFDKKVKSTQNGDQTKFQTTGRVVREQIGKTRRGGGL